MVERRDESGAEPVVVHVGDGLLVVEKPAGMATTAADGGWCLVRWVEERFPELRAHPTSRLDSPVSGLVTFALDKQANARLLDARRAGAYERLYVGVSLHDVEPSRGQWAWPISMDPSNAKLRRAGSGRGERDALTSYHVVDRSALGSVLHLRPRTGRTHQLRVHAAKAGAPLFGDHAYGGERRLTLSDGRVLTARRVMLHCHRVSYPWGPERREFESPLPEGFRHIMRAVAKAGGPPESRGG